MPKVSRRLSAALLVVIGLVLLLVQVLPGGRTADDRPGAAVPTLPSVVSAGAVRAGAGVAPAGVGVDTTIGFRSTAKLRDHWRKHGREFGSVTEAQYLLMAQSLRDAPLSGVIAAAVQPGGTLSRFDRSSGAFLAYDPDLTIRTFFKPDAGEAYFRRAARRSH